MRGAEPTLTITMRLPWALKERLDESAYRNRRSRTKEILAAIDAHLAREGQQHGRSDSAGGVPAAGEASRA